jgi:hypothetical protein
MAGIYYGMKKIIYVAGELRHLRGMKPEKTSQEPPSV